MAKYVVEAWWTSTRQALVTLEAASPSAALRKAERMLVDGDDDWIADNYECDDSYGPTNLCVWDESRNTILDELASPQFRLESAAETLLQALKRLLVAYTRVTRRHPTTGDDGSGVIDAAIVHAAAAIREAEAEA